MSKFDESLADFVQRRLGNEALEQLTEPLISGIYFGNPRILSAEWCNTNPSVTAAASFADCGNRHSQEKRQLLPRTGKLLIPISPELISVA